MNIELCSIGPFVRVMSESMTVPLILHVYSFGTGTHGAEVGLQVDEWLPDSRTPSTDSSFTCCADYSS